ncbi:reverse transcriptase domain-containing protein [Tanacetum coccineum]|uniref:Reverse transcriptase domain-containing protein n=1 Tax=Tanacetum coccineum TaxID=301880 RepID=A0ABQ5EXN8_9ASTR
MAPNRRSGPSSSNNNENPDVATVIAQQLQAIITQVANNANNANNGNNGGGNGLMMKTDALLRHSNLAIPRSTMGKVCQARGRVAAMALSWNDFKALMVEEFCPSNEMEKLENEFWNHKMVGANHAAYTNRFYELAKLVPHLVTPESSRIKRYIAGLAPEIRGMLRATQPTTIQTAILRAGILTDEAVSCDNKKAKTRTGFVATTPARNEAGNSNPKCNKCFTIANHEPEAEVAPIPPPPVPANPEPEAVTVGTGRLTPLKRLFTDTQVWIGSSSSSTAASHDPEDLTPSHIRSDLDALHRRVWHIEEDDVRAENKRPRMMFDCSENRTRAAWRELDQAPYVLPSALRVPVTHNDPKDPYIAIRNAATAPATDNDDSPTHEETSPSKPQASSPRDS